MTRGRSLQHRPARVGAGLLLAAILAVMLGPIGVARATGPVPVDGSLAELTLGTVSPIAPQETDTLRLTGQLTNDTVLPLQHLTLRLYLNRSQLSTRTEFDQYAARSPGDDFALDELEPVPTATATLPRPSLAVGGSESWSISVPMADLAPLAPWEVYRLGVAVSDADGTTVGRLRTFLPYAPVDQGVGRKPLSVAWVWPLVDRPHRNVTAGGTDAFVDDALAQELAAKGRLGRLLSAAVTASRQHPAPVRHRSRHGRAAQPAVRLPRQPVPVTFAVDPMLLSELKRMAAGYQVHDGGKPRPGTGRGAAASFLGQLKSALSSSTAAENLLALPYADPDLVAAVKAHATQQLATAFSLGSTVAGQVLGPQNGRILSGWAWPADGFADTATVNWLSSQRIQTLLLSTDGFPPVAAPAYTPNAAVTLPSRDTPLTGLLADSTLSQVVADGSVSGSGQALQRYLAETLMIEAELPSTADRSILVAPPRRWSPPPGYATQLLTDTGRVPWIQPTTLPAAAQAPTRPGDLTRRLAYPAVAERAELPARYVQSVRKVTTRVNRLGAILPAGSNLVRADDEAILQALSGAWRGQRAAAADYRTALNDQVVRTIGQVRIATAGSSLITLTSHSGTVPITIYNGLDQPARVGIRLLTGHRLSITGGYQTHTIPPHQRISVDVRATANVSGSFPVKARLLTPGEDAQPYGSQVVMLYIRSTAYGTVAIAITAAACAVLFIAVAYRLARRALAARRPAAAGGPG